MKISRSVHWFGKFSVFFSAVQHISWGKFNNFCTKLITCLFKEQNYKNQLEEEKKSHINTKNSLESIRKELEDSKEENKRIAKRNEELLNKFKSEVSCDKNISLGYIFKK